MSNNRTRKGIFELFCDLLFGPAQLEIGRHILAALSFWLLFQAFWSLEYNSIRKEPVYKLTDDKISVGKRPLWIPPTLEEEAIRSDSRLRERSVLSIIDKDLGADLLRAFRHHPWICEVNSVTIKYPGFVQIDAQYRTPIAFVETSSTVADGVQSVGVYQIDSDGVLLPTDYLQVLLANDTEAAKKYLSIQGIKSTPVEYGHSWGKDPILLEAALLAEFLQKDFQQLGIRIILVSGGDGDQSFSSEQRPPNSRYTLETVGGKKINWGEFAMSELIRIRSEKSPDYPLLKEKIFRKYEPKLQELKRLAGSNSLDSLNADQFPIDLSQFD